MNTLKFYLTLILVFIGYNQSFSQDIVEEPFAYSSELVQLAEQGDTDAMYKLGVCYYVGTGGLPGKITNAVPLEKDLVKAYSYWEKAANMGHILSMLEMGNIHISGIGAPSGQNFKTAKEWYEKAASKGCATAYSSIGNIFANQQPLLLYNYGLIETNAQLDPYKALFEAREKAIENFLKAVELGSAQGAYNMNIMKLGVCDYQESIEWLRKSIELGSRTAINDLAVRYQNGQGISQDKRFALTLMIGAMKRKEPMAIHNIGAYYYQGTMLPLDKEKALFFFIKSEQLGYKVSHAPIYHQYYEEGVCNAKNFTSEQDWLSSLIKEYESIELPDIEIPEPQVVYSLDAVNVVNDCGSWYFANKENICMSERKYDKIEKDNNGTFKATLSKFQTTLDENGLEETPIMEVILNQTKDMTNSAELFQNSIYLIQTDYDNSLGYRAIAYYNIAVYYFNLNQFFYAELYLRKAVEEDPDLEEAKEFLAQLPEQIEIKKAENAALFAQNTAEVQAQIDSIKKQIKKENRKTIFKAITSGLLMVASQYASSQTDLGSGHIPSEYSENNSKKHERISRLKAQHKENRKAMVTRGNKGARDAYSGYASQLNDLKNNGQYGTKEFRDIQAKGKSLEQQYGLSHFEQFDW